MFRQNAIACEIQLVSSFFTMMKQERVVRNSLNLISIGSFLNELFRLLIFAEEKVDEGLGSSHTRPLEGR